MSALEVFNLARETRLKAKSLKVVRVVNPAEGVQKVKDSALHIITCVLARNLPWTR